MLRRVTPVAVCSALLMLLALLSGCGSLSGTNEGGYITGDGQALEYPAGKRGEPVSLSGTTHTGDQLNLADVTAKAVVVNVWWSGCGPCRTEMPMLQSLSGELAGTAEFVGINIRDNSRESGLAFERDLGVTYPSIYSPDGRALLGFHRRLPAALPVTVVLDAERRIAGMVSGPIPSELTLTDLVECAADSNACGSTDG